MDDQIPTFNSSLGVDDLQKALCEMQAPGNESDRSFCPPSWDTVLCWPKTDSGTLAILPCFEELSGIKYDASENATRHCLSDGTWHKYSNYNSCQPLPPTMHPEFDHANEDMSTLYLVGYSLSLVALCIAVYIFLYFKDLRCLRNTIHTHLMFTFMLTDFTWIVTLIQQLAATQTHSVSCVMLITLLHYFLLTNYFWTFVEGLYLYMLVVETFSGENIKLRVYVMIGWGTPVIIILIWAIVKSFGPVIETQTSGDADCPLMAEHPYDWIFMGPVLAVLAVNVIFLVKIMWVLITKLRSANTVETQQYRKATKALLVLIPLLGVTYILTIVGPSNGLLAKIFDYTRATLLSTQGLIVTLFYCFLNTEVQNTVRHHLESWKTERSLVGSRRYHYSSKDWSPRSRAESIRLFNRPVSRYGKRESTVSETTTTTLVGGSNNNGSNTYNSAVRMSTPFLMGENSV